MADGDYDITQLMYPRAEYKVPPEPRLDSLLLDTVMKGRPRASQCRLLQLPAEILARIVDLLAGDNHALKQLALVNSDCRGLARACQFVEVTFDYSIPMASFFANRLRNHVPNLIDCIRKFIYNPDSNFVMFFHSNVYKAWRGDQQALTEDEFRQLKEEAGSNYQHIRRLSGINNIGFMSNLETLVWHDKFPLDKESFMAIINSKAHHLALRKVTITEGWSLGPPLTPPQWHLRSLYLDVRLALACDLDSDVEPENSRPNPCNTFFNTLFQLCSPTLEALTWVPWKVKSHLPLSLEITAESFPRLRLLRLDTARDTLVESTIASLLSIPVRSLELKGDVYTKFKHLINARIKEPYRDLEEFVARNKDMELVASFVHKHNHLKKLYVTQEYYCTGCNTHFDNKLIPALGNGRFNNLRSLYLQWGGQNKDYGRKNLDFDIPLSSLVTICELTSLEQLCLRCDEGFHDDMEYAGITFPQWAIDHESVQAHLKNLKNLKMLAILGDTYAARIQSVSHNFYYRYSRADHQDYSTAKENPKLGPFVEAPDERQLAWEHAHLYRMLQHANAYHDVLPKLEWIICGQRPMEFKTNAEGTVEAYPIGKERVECMGYLESVFSLAPSAGGVRAHHKF